MVAETDALGHTTIYQYDAYNPRIWVNAPGVTTGFAYDFDSNLISTTDGNDVSTIYTYTYDALNRQITQSVPGGTTALQIATYDALSDVIQVKDAAGGIATAQYDDFGRVTHTTNSAGLNLNYDPNALDEVTQTTWPNHSTQVTVYDSNNGQLVSSVTDRSGNTTAYSYNARFQQVGSTAGNGGMTSLSYDPFGRLARKTDALDQSTAWVYNQFDAVTQLTYPDSTALTPRVATNQYDDYGKLTTQGGTGQYPVTYGYDAAGNRTSLIDGNHSQTQWVYDESNRVTAKTYADQSTYHYSYDLVGNLASRTDALGHITQYNFNKLNSISQVTYPTNAPVYSKYDILNRRTQMSDGTGTTDWTWNSADQNTSSSQSSINETLSYLYDAESHHTQTTVGNWTTSYGYDAGGRLSTLVDSRVSAQVPSPMFIKRARIG